MEGYSTAGLIGAGVGLLLGLGQTYIVANAVERTLRRTDRSRNEAEKQDYELKIGYFRRLLYLVNVMVFPVVGYYAARAVMG